MVSMGPKDSVIMRLTCILFCYNFGVISLKLNANLTMYFPFHNYIQKIFMRGYFYETSASFVRSR